MKVHLHFFARGVKQDQTKQSDSEGMTIYDSCAAAHGGDLQLMMECISNWIETETNNGKLVNSQVAAAAAANYVSADDLNSWLLVLAGALVFFMQAGFAMVCAGAIRKKNVNNTMLKNLLDACGAGIAFYTFGYAFAYGSAGEDSSTFVGNDNFFLLGDTDPAFFFFQFAFSATAVTIVAGTLAERCKMASYFSYSFFLTGFVYPVVVHNIWSKEGYFSTANSNALVGMGMVDFSGSGVVHLTGGTTALFATYILGPRRGRFYDGSGIPLSKPGLAKGHSVSMQMLGTMILWFCWYGFNPGSALLLSVDNKGSIAALAAVNTTLGAAAGAISALFTNGIICFRRQGEFTLDIVMAMNGCLSGLVAITAGCGVVDQWAAIIIGVVSGWVYICADKALIRYKLDDAVSAIPVHMANGLWGVLAVGLFAAPDLLQSAYGTDSHPGWFYAPTSSNLMGAQLVGALFIMSWTLVTMLPFFMALDYLGWFRVNELEELVGLDASYHGSSPAQTLFDDESSTNEEVRLAAYKQRFEERKQMRTQYRTVKKMTVEELLNASWGRVDFAGSDGSVDGIVPEIKETPAEAPEQAPVTRVHKADLTPRSTKFESFEL